MPSLFIPLGRPSAVLPSSAGLSSQSLLDCCALTTRSLRSCRSAMLFSTGWFCMVILGLSSTLLLSVTLGSPSFLLWPDLSYCRSLVPCLLSSGISRVLNPLESGELYTDTLTFWTLLVPVLGQSCVACQTLICFAFDSVVSWLVPEAISRSLHVLYCSLGWVGGIKRFLV